MTYFLELYSVMNVCASISDVKWEVEQQLSLLFHKPTIFHTCTHDMEPCSIKVKWSRYRPGVAQRVGRLMALLFHDRGTRRGWVVSSTPRPHFTPWKDPVPILQEAGWAPGPVWTGGKSRSHRDSIRDRLARSQSLYRQSYPAHPALSLSLSIYIYIYIRSTPLGLF